MFTTCGGSKTSVATLLGADPVIVTVRVPMVVLTAGIGYEDVFKATVEAGITGTTPLPKAVVVFDDIVFHNVPYTSNREDGDVLAVTIVGRLQLRSPVGNMIVPLVCGKEEEEFHPKPAGAIAELLPVVSAAELAMLDSDSGPAKLLVPLSLVRFHARAATTNLIGLASAKKARLSKRRSWVIRARAPEQWTDAMMKDVC